MGGIMIRRMGAAGVAIAASLSSTHGHACEPPGSVLFSCATAQGNRIEICDAGPSIWYSFGEPGLIPQVAVAIPRDDITLAPWRSLGKVESYALKIPYREAVHVVYWSLDDPGDQPEAGVQVLVDDRLRTTMQCVPGQIRNNIPRGGFRGIGG